MKKVITLLTILLYFCTSNILVHSFCAESHIEEQKAIHADCDHGDTGPKDCFDHCMGSFGDTVPLVYEFTKKSTNNDNFGSNSIVFSDTELVHTQKYFLTEIVYDPPWQENYIGVTKKVE